MRTGGLRVAFFGIGLAVTALAASPPELPPSVVSVPVSYSEAFRDATAPDAIRLLCAPAVDTLQAAFASQGLVFEPKLVRKKDRQGRYCHVAYRPSIAGYRAARDQQKIEALQIGVDPMAFFAGRAPIGGSLDVAKVVLPRLKQPLHLTITVRSDFPKELWQPQVRKHFPESTHSFRVRASALVETHPWVQDQIKDGQVGGERLTLVPHRLFEGRGEDGPMYAPLLDALEKEGMRRSKLAWDGGDVQFAALPGRPGETLLVHGGAARDYWGMGLSLPEYSFVLRQEFGATRALDLTMVGPHADYLVAVLPLDNIAFVSKPIAEDVQLIESAVMALERFLGDRAPLRLRQLNNYLRTWDRNLETNREALGEQITLVRREIESLPPAVDPALLEEMAAYAASICAGNEFDCLREEHAPTLLAKDPDLLRRSADGAASMEMHSNLPKVLLGIIEGQVSWSLSNTLRGVDSAATELKKLGFKVIRTPYLVAPMLGETWPGMSFANMLAVERQLFIPSLGLGEFEERELNDLRRKLGPQYEVVAVPARVSILGNGGVHCVFGIYRAPEPGPAVSDGSD